MISSAFILLLLSLESGGATLDCPKTREDKKRRKPCHSQSQVLAEGEGAGLRGKKEKEAPA
jgi:hypothetical protein